MRLPFFGKLEEEQDQKDGGTSRLDELFRISDQMRRHIEPEWFANARFLVGQNTETPTGDLRQWLTTRRLPRVIPTDEDPARTTVNIVYTLYRQAMASLCDNLAIQIATPATSEPLDIAAAEIATDLLGSRYDEDKEKSKRRRDIGYTLVCGRAYRKTYFDPDLDGIGEFGRLPGAGDIVSEVCSPLRLLIDPWSETFDECSYVIETEIRDVDELNDLYPGSDVQQEECLDGSYLLDVFLTNVSGNTSYGMAVPKRKGAVVFKRMYLRATPEIPDGRVYYWANGKRLRPPGTLPSGIFPFDAYEWMPIPGRNHPLPFVTPLRDPHRQYNELLRLLVKLAQAQLRGDVAFQGDGKVVVDEDPKTKQKWIRLPYGTLKFELMRYDLNPTVAEARLAQLWNDCQQLSGLRDPSLGKNPPGVRTVGAIMMLRESDTAGMSFFRVGIDDVNSSVARKKVQLAKMHYIQPRMVRVVGETSLPRVTAFFGAELRNTQDIRSRTIPPMTEIERRQVRQESIAAGAYGPYLDPTGAFDPRVKLARMEMLLATGLPGIEDEVDRICAPLTLEKLRELAGQLDMLDTDTAIKMAQMRGALASGAGMGSPQGAPSPMGGGAPAPTPMAVQSKGGNPNA